ncbi:MAG: hypothetical protein KF886_20665 [Candidatus Hydrogenedentes bacterium]|nr:hypothetical protein [Candidatus Hydrogenedentota bacterium]
MIKDKIVRVKLKRNFHEQRPLSYVGKVTAFSDYWVVMEAIGVLIARNQPNNVQIDKHRSAALVPRDNIESIVLLPDNFDVKSMKITTEGQQIQIVVTGGANVYIGELGDG